MLLMGVGGYFMVMTGDRAAGTGRTRAAAGAPRTDCIR